MKLFIRLIILKFTFELLLGCYLKKIDDHCPGYDTNNEYSEQNVITAKANGLKIGQLVINNDIVEDLTLEIYHPDSWNNHVPSVFPIKNNGIIRAKSIDTIKGPDNMYISIGNDWGIRVLSITNRSCLRILSGGSEFIQNQHVVTVSKLLY